MTRPSRRGAAIAALAVLAIQAPAFAAPVNDPRPTLLYPGDGDSRRSMDVPIVFARFDRGLREGSTMTLVDASSAAVSGTVRLNEPEGEPESWRMIEFIPTTPLAETGSPFTATAHACGFVAGSCVDIEWDFDIDDTAPLRPTISSPANNSVVTDQVVTVTGTAEAGALVVAYENPNMQDPIAMQRATTTGAYTMQLPYPPADGTVHEIRLVAIDRAGNVSPLTAIRRFIHDSILLLPIITSPAQGSFTNVATVQVEGRAKAGSTVTIEEGSTTLATDIADADTRFEASVTFAHGVHTITATSFDGFMTDGPSPAVTFTVDLVAPSAPIVLLPAPGASVPGPNVVIAGTGEPLGTVRVRQGVNLRGSAPIDVSGDWTLSLPFTDATHTITVEVTDRAGNVSPGTVRTFTVDSVAPVAPIVTMPADGSVLPTSSVAIAGVAEADALVAISEHGSVIGTTLATPSGSWGTSLSFPDGTHTIQVRAIDAAGNVSPGSSDVTFAVDTVVPVAPVILQPYAADIYDRVPITVTGTSEPNLGITILEGSTALALTTAATDGSWTTQITVGSGPRTIEATATDLAGNVSPPSAAVTFTYDPGAPDATAPPAPGILTPTPADIVPELVAMIGVAEPFARVDIFEGPTLIATANADLDGAWGTGRRFAGTEAEALLGHHVHTIRAFATDLAGNTSVSSSLRTFTVDAKRPTVQITSTEDVPIIATTLLPGSIAGTATDNLSVVAVELEATNRITNERLGTFAALCSTCPGAAVSWTATLALPPGLYRVEAFAVDAAGQRSPPDSVLLLNLTV
jgi:hypothetical protein